MLLRKIEKHLNDTGTAPATFGRATVGDPGFVFDLRNGREPRSRTTEKIMLYLAKEGAVRDETNRIRYAVKGDLLAVTGPK